MFPSSREPKRGAECCSRHWTKSHLGPHGEGERHAPSGASPSNLRLGEGRAFRCFQLLSALEMLQEPADEGALLAALGLKVHKALRKVHLLSAGGGRRRISSGGGVFIGIAFGQRRPLAAYPYLYMTYKLHTI